MILVKRNKALKFALIGLIVSRNVVASTLPQEMQLDSFYGDLVKVDGKAPDDSNMPKGGYHKNLTQRIGGWGNNKNVDMEDDYFSILVRDLAMGKVDPHKVKRDIEDLYKWDGHLESSDIDINVQIHEFTSNDSALAKKESKLLTSDYLKGYIYKDNGISRLAMITINSCSNNTVNITA